jgi:hypothetical protein
VVTTARQNPDDFIKGLEADGLIKPGKTNIEWKENKLFVNGAEQPKETTAKYIQYQGMNLSIEINEAK